MARINVADLQRGDVLLKFSEGTATNALIEVGQWIFSHNASGGHAWTVHAAIFAGGRAVYEASGGGGLRCAQFKSGVLYFAHRYANAGLAEMAADVAEGYVAEKGRGADYGAYSKSGAFGSLFHNSHRGRGARRAEVGLWGASPNVPSSSFYCSSFVVRAYIAAGQTVEPAVVPVRADYRFVSPKELEARLKSDSNWREIGSVVT
jgi:hypothetical protein